MISSTSIRFPMALWALVGISSISGGHIPTEPIVGEADKKDRRDPIKSEAVQSKALRITHPSMMDRQIFHERNTSVEEGKIKRFCRETNIEFAKVVEIASNIQPVTHSEQEKLDAMAIASVVLSIQNGKGHVFYLAENSEGKKENKEFIDTIMIKIQEGKLKIEDARGRARSSSGDPFEFTYDPSTNTISFYKDIDMLGLQGRAIIVHELYHFYQDIKAVALSKLETEFSAYEKGGEYVILSEGLTNKSPEFLEEFINQQIKNREEKTSFRLSYFRRVKDTERIKQLSLDLENHIHYYSSFLLRIFIHQMNDQIKRVSETLSGPLKMEGGLQILKNTILTWSEDEIAVWKALEKELKEVSEVQKRSGFLSNQTLIRQTNERVNRKVQEYVIAALQVIILKRIYREFKELKEAGLVVNDFKFRMTLKDPEIQELKKKILNLRPTAYIYLPHDGVH